MLLSLVPYTVYTLVPYTVCVCVCMCVANIYREAGYTAHKVFLTQLAADA